MTTIDFKYSEGDSVTLVTRPDLGEFEVSGLHCCNGSNSYTINDGVEEQGKFEYQLKLVKQNKVKPRAIGFKERPEEIGKPIAEHIGNTHGIELNNSDFEQ